MAETGANAVQQEPRNQLRLVRRWVIKIGSALLTNNGRGLDTAAIAGWVEQIAALRAAGAQVVLVSSGAVAEGMVRLGLSARPDAIHELQACAAVGQMGLVQAWESLLAKHGLRTAQVLLTHDDLADRRRYLNARSALRTLLEFGVIPVVNENDTVVTDEIRFGDNDTLGALVTNLVEAEALVILTDQKGMFERDPRVDPDAPLISQAFASDESLVAKATGNSGSGLGRGGMATKIRAARLAARSGAKSRSKHGTPAANSPTSRKVSSSSSAPGVVKKIQGSNRRTARLSEIGLTRVDGALCNAKQPARRPDRAVPRQGTPYAW